MNPVFKILVRILDYIVNNKHGKCMERTKVGYWRYFSPKPNSSSSVFFSGTKHLRYESFMERNILILNRNFGRPPANAFAFCFGCH